MIFTQKYLEILNTEFQGLNLTNIKDPKDFEIKQYEDSIYPIKENLIDLSKYSHIYDIGFGGGFPILPLAFKSKELNFIGIESRAKKVKAVSTIAKAMGIENVDFFHSRIEDFKFKKNSLIISKAVGPVSRIIDWVRVSSGTELAFYKGANFSELEAKEIETIEKQWSIITNVEYELSNGDLRTFFIIKKK